MKEKAHRKGCKTARKVGERWPEICQRETENVDLECREERAEEDARHYKARFDLEEVNAHLNSGDGERPQQVVRFNFQIGLLFAIATLFLIGAETALATWAFDPIRQLDPVKKILITAGLIFGGFLAFERVLTLLQRCCPPRTNLVLCLYIAVAAAVAAGVAIMGLALVRGFLFEALVGSRMAEASASGAAASFYGRAGPLLKLLFVAMAIALLCTGALTMKEASERVVGSWSVLKLYRKREKLQNLMTEIPARLERLDALPRIFENEFTRGAMETMESMKRKKESFERNGNRRLLFGLGLFVCVLLLVLFFASSVFAKDVVVVGIDMSLSQNAADFEGTKEFDRNLRAVGERIIPALREDTELYVVAITGSSFARPFYILKGRTGKEHGYFDEFLEADIQRIAEEWKKVSQSLLRPTEKYTDVLGFLNLADMIFTSSPAKKRTLAIFSDMRQCTPEVNLESPERIEPGTLERLKDRIYVPELDGVDVYVYGVHCYGKSVLYYEDIRDFWFEFFTLTKGNLRTYSNMREVNLNQE